MRLWAIVGSVLLIFSMVVLLLYDALPKDRVDSMPQLKHMRNVQTEHDKKDTIDDANRRRRQFLLDKTRKERMLTISKHVKRVAKGEVKQNLTTLFKLHTVVPKLALILFTHNRYPYLQSTLSHLEVLPEFTRYPVFLSQHGMDEDVDRVCRNFTQHHSNAKHWILKHHNDASKNLSSAHHIAMHYRAALERVFDSKRDTLWLDEQARNDEFDYVILLEDDMIVSIDFLSYFEQTQALLLDDSVFCVSSWNDNGLSRFAHDSHRLRRTDFFPGLGWMLSKAVWSNDLREFWPRTHWDHWIRLSSVRRNRQCIVPEVSRTYNFGISGAHVNLQSWKEHLKLMRINTQRVEFSSDELNMVRYDEYEARLRRHLKEAHVVSLDDALVLRFNFSASPKTKEVFVVKYKTEHWPSIASVLHLRSPCRGHFQHVLELRLQRYDALITLLLVDVRLSPLIEHRVHAPPRLRSIAAANGISCASLCAHMGARCSPEHFVYINDCVSLAQKFGCVHTSCSVGGGENAPVITSSNQCLLLEIGDVGNCTSVSHDNDKQRICACV